VLDQDKLLKIKSALGLFSDADAQLVTPDTIAVAASSLDDMSDSELAALAGRVVEVTLRRMMERRVGF
jgi:hypothetical protein